MVRNRKSTQREEVEDAIIELYGEDKPEELARVLFYFDDRGDEASPAIRVLHRLIGKDAFSVYVERLAEDTRKAENNRKFYKAMELMYLAMLEENDDPFQAEWEGLKPIIKANSKAPGSSVFSIIYSCDRMPPATQKAILETIKNIGKSRNSMVVFDDAIRFLSKPRAGAMVMTALVAAQLSWEALVNIYKWYKGEISGKRCGKNIVDALVSVGCGVLGGAGGASIGSAFGPVGTVIGACVGGLVSSLVAEQLADQLTQRIFCLPKEVAVEKAYDFFGLKCDASNADINRAYHRISRERHPDRPGGSHQAFIEVQVQLQLIREARGEPPVVSNRILAMAAGAIAVATQRAMTGTQQEQVH